MASGGVNRERPRPTALADQWRGDCLSGAAHPVVQTPTCIPARAALYAGLGQRSHGRVGYRDKVPWNYPTTIASELGFQHVTLHDGFLHSARAKPRDLVLPPVVELAIRIPGFHR